MKWGYIELLNPYVNWENEDTKNYFQILITLKKSGYEKNYENILALDRLDFVADYYLIWIERDEAIGREYVACMRSISFETTQYYNLDDPCMGLLNVMKEHSDVSAHRKRLEQYYWEFRESPASIRFCGGWTTHADFRKFDPVIKQAALASIPLSQESNNAHLTLGNGMLHLKTDQAFISMGYEKWSDNGVELPPVKSPGFNNHQTVFIAARTTNEEYSKKLEFFKEQWSCREVIGHKQQLVTKKAA